MFGMFATILCAVYFNAAANWTDPVFTIVVSLFLGIFFVAYGWYELGKTKR